MKNIRLILFMAISIIASNKTFAKEKIVIDSIRLEINALLKEFNNKDVKVNDKISTALELTYYYSGYYPGVLVKKMDSAIYYSGIAYTLAIEIKDTNLIYQAGTSYANYYSKCGNFSKSISTLLELKNNPILNKYSSEIYSSISDAYREAGDYKNYLKYARQELYNNIKNSKSNFYSLGFYATIGDAFSNLNELDSAYYYYNKDYENFLLNQKEFTKYDSKFDSTKRFFANRWIVFMNMGEINLKLGENEIALTYFKKVIDAINRTTETNVCNQFYLQVAKCYNNLNQNKLALLYARASYRLSNFYVDNKNIIESAHFLSEIFKHNKMLDSAYHYQSIYMHLKDSIYNNEQANNIAIISIEENIKQEKIKQQIEKEKHDREQNLILAGIGFFIPVFISLVFLVSKWSKKKSKLFTSLGIASLLMLFEFISLLIHPYVEKLTNHNVAFMYIILLIIASALVPIHHKMEAYLKNYFQE
jgi:tetratricopeptide (TPR) repeat protein